MVLNSHDSDLSSSYHHSQTTGTNEPIIVVCSADDNYAMQVAVTGRSILEHLPGDRSIQLFIIDGGIRDGNREKILQSLSTKNCEVMFLPRPDALLGRDIEEINKTLGPDGKTIAGYVSVATFFRLFIPELLPSDVTKAIYLDCDLVVRGNLEQLWNLDLEDHYVLAAQDTWVRTVASEHGLLNYRELGIPAEAKYFNAGVLVLNLKKWREDNICQQAMTYLKHNKPYVRWHDQDVLNPLFAERWGQLDPRWNFIPSSFFDYDLGDYSSWETSPFSEETYRNLVHDPYIVHFTSAKKPWNSRHTVAKEYFFHYVDRTAWAGWRLTFWRRLGIKLSRHLKSLRSKIKAFQ